MKEKYILCSPDQYEQLHQAMCFFNGGYEIPKITKTINGNNIIPVSVNLQIKIPDLFDGLDGFEIIDDIW